MFKEDNVFSRICADLQSQHHRDLKIYRAAHCERRNRILHWILIPVECWSILLLFTALLPLQITIAAGLVLGLTSLIIATKNILGVTAFVFHLIAIWICWVVQSWGTAFALEIAGGSWIIAWTLQVGIGHWMWEKNQPNISNTAQVSYLAMCQSILIAWSS